MNKDVIGILAPARRLACVPWLGLPPFYESFLYLVCHWAVLALSWNILSGYSGYFSFGHGAFFGIGMYATRCWRALQLAVPGDAAIGGAAAGAAGPVHRLRRVPREGGAGELFALLTLAVTFVIATIILNTPIDGGPGVYLNAVQVPRLAPTPSSSIYLMILFAAALTLLVAYRVQVSKLGIGLFAIHDDEDVAEVMGVPTFRYKLLAFALSCALAGLAGGIHALFVSYVTAGETFNITVPLTVVLMSVLGGTRIWAGRPWARRPSPGCCTLHGRRPRGGGQGRGGRDPGAGDPVHARRHPGLRASARRPAAACAAAARRPRGACRPADARRSRRHRQAAARSARPVQGLQGRAGARQRHLQVRQGEILGLLGPTAPASPPSSTSSAAITRCRRRDRVRRPGLTGRRRTAWRTPASRAPTRSRAPFAHMTVLQNVAMVAMFGCAALREKEAEREAWKWLEFTGLPGQAQALPET
jgi:branched-chain amino acid transport system permease protein